MIRKKVLKSHFRQDNDFYYFTGIEDINAILIMAPKKSMKSKD